MTAKKDRSDVVALPRPKPTPAPEQPEPAEPAKVLPFEKPRRRCEVTGCTNPHQARGRCMRHYHHWRRENEINADLPCTKCGVNRRSQGHSWCQPCINEGVRERFRHYYNTDPTFYSAKRIKNAEANFRLKAEVLAGYGGRCNCCGELEFSMLQLDHVFGGGAQERRAHSGWWQGVYRRAKREGFPPDLQCLCANCNFSKATLGRCAHQGGEVIYPAA